MSSGPPTPVTPLSPRRWPLRLALAGGLALLLAGAVVALLTRRPAPLAAPEPGPSVAVPDPRLDYKGPFLNIAPAVRHVGDSACAGCHADKTETYRDHPMGRSLALLRDVGAQPPHNGRNSRFEAFRSLFEVERRGQQVWHTQTRRDEAGPLYTFELEAHYVVGSGTRGYSYLNQRDGFLVQTAASWFAQKGVWDLSPGFTAALLPGRPITPDCLFCHANRTRHREGTINGYDEPVFDGHAIGCERCHGPGERHVRQRTGARAFEGPVDYTIVHPGKLAPALREAVCEQCHLAGQVRLPRRGRGLDDFRPGMPLDLFWSVFVRERRPGADSRAVNHVEQMYLSRCFQRSSGDDKLGCVSCHDPHRRVAPARRVEYYRDRCLECHDERGCGLPRPTRLRQNRQDSCIDCHMPPYSASDIAHTAATDHRIVRRPTPARAVTPPPTGDLVPWRSGTGALPASTATEDPERARDLGIALARLAESGKGEPKHLAGRAAELLEASVATFPDDVAALEARGVALAVLGRHDEALASFEAALARAPRRELSLRGAARLAQNGNLRDRALDYWQRAVAVNPRSADGHANLAVLLAHGGQWQEASRHGRAWLRLDPGSLEARRFWARCLLEKGDRTAARAELDRLRRLR